MAGLTGQTVASSYKSLLRTVDNNHGVSAGLQSITDGEGTVSCVEIADDALRVTPQDGDSTGIFSVRDKDSNYLLRVDSNNDIVKVNSGQEIANTQYAYFGVTSIDSAGYAADTHNAIPFNGNGHADLTYPPAFGTGTDPATSFTTSHGNGTKASDLVPCLWYVQDNISIDAVTAIEGADTATGETTDIHLMQYTFSSGGTSALTSGALVAHNTPFVNAGDEQAYKTTLTIDATDGNIDAGKVILAFFEPVGTVNSDYSINITVKYHLR